jgi:hypothetical protein
VLKSPLLLSLKIKFDINPMKYLLMACLFIGCSYMKQVDEKHYIPQGYTGIVMIVYNQPDGEKPSYDKDKSRIYNIHGGLLKTQFRCNRLSYDDVRKIKFYYKSADGSTQELPYLSRQEAKTMTVKDSNQIVVFEMKNISVTKDSMIYTSYQVDTYRNCTYTYFDPLYPDE